MPKLTKELLNDYNKISIANEDCINVGMNTCSISSGGEKVYNALIKAVDEKNIPIKIKKCGCLGMCHCEPVIEVKLKGKPPVLYGNVDVNKALKILDGDTLSECVIEDNPYQVKIVLRNCGNINPEDIEEYLAVGGYQALKK